MDLPKMPLRELLTIGEGRLGIVHLGRVFKKNKKLLCLKKKNNPKKQNCLSPTGTITSVKMLVILAL